MKLSIIIPIYNEKETLPEIIRQVEAVNLTLEKEIILVDDGSDDGTGDLLSELAHKYQVILKEKNEGKGSAIREGFLKATGDVAIIQDADLEYDPEEYSLVIGPILANRADVVIGSRFVGGKPHRVIYAHHYYANKFLTLLSNFLSGLNLTDMECCYKALKKEVYQKIAPKLESKRFGIEPELVARISKEKKRVYEVGISYYGRTYEEGKKINWKDGLAAVYHIIKFNFFK